VLQSSALHPAKLAAGQALPVALLDLQLRRHRCTLAARWGLRQCRAVLGVSAGGPAAMSGAVGSSWWLEAGVTQECECHVSGRIRHCAQLGWLISQCR
jgi:hypothetical protein